MSIGRTGKHLVVCHYGSRHVRFQPAGCSGAVSGPYTEWLAAEVGAHPIKTDRSDRFAFAPRIDRLLDYVLSSVKNLPGPKTIYRFRFEDSTGLLPPELTAERGWRRRPCPSPLCFSAEPGGRFFRRAGHQFDLLPLEHRNRDAFSLPDCNYTPEGNTHRNTTSPIRLNSAGSPVVRSQL